MHPVSPLRETSNRRGFRLFSAGVDEPRARRAGDAVLLVLGVVILAFLGIVAAPPAQIEAALIAFLERLPQVLSGAWTGMVWSLFVLAAVVLIVTLLRRRWAVARDMLAGAVLAILLGLTVGWLAVGSWDLLWAWPTDNEYWIPWLRLTLPATVILVANPHLAHSMRVFGWWAIALAAAASTLSGATAPTSSVASLTIALIAAAATHLVFGSCRGRPSLHEVATDLAGMGTDVVRLGEAERQRAGVFVVDAETADGRRLLVKVYGRDAHDTQRLSAAWRSVWSRGPGTPLSAGRLEQVEHEAFLTLFAANSGILTQGIVAAGMAPNDDAVLVLEEAGQPVDSLDPSDAAALWATIRTLHRARITHGQVDREHLIAGDGRIGLTDFSAALLSANPWRRRIDQVQGLVETVLGIGVSPALDLARQALGDDELAALLPYLQLDPLTRSQRHRLDEADVDMDEVREEASTALGVAPPELEKLRRVTWGSLLRVGLPILAFFALANVVAGLDLDDLASSMADASWGFVAAGLILAQVPRVFQAMSALGASPIPVPLSRLYLLQLAQSYIALTIPGGAARIALNVRFFQRQGLNSGAALTVGALDSFAGFLSQLVLLGLVVLFSSASIDLDFDSDTTAGLLRLAWIVALVVLGVVLVTVAVPRLRRMVFGRLRQLLGEARSALRGLASPRRLVLLFGGNITNEIMLAIALGAFTLALGESIGLAQLLVINITVSLFAGLVPIPGGIGVVEGALIFGLARAGIPEAAAFASAIMYRAATYYLPPIWGWPAFRSLTRAKHL